MRVSLIKVHVCSGQVKTTSTRKQSNSTPTIQIWNIPKLHIHAYQLFSQDGNYDIIVFIVFEIIICWINHSLNFNEQTSLEFEITF